MKLKLLLLSALLLVGCGEETKVVYIDSSTGVEIQPVVKKRYMRHQEHDDELVCFHNRQYYKFYNGASAVYIPNWPRGYSAPAFCDNNTLADGTRDE